uniref:Uncharacterized protein n=1 Tax=Anguilla anguilla TaxID=7936 RepID=A0A0E9RV62_ANGAN
MSTACFCLFNKCQAHACICMCVHEHFHTQRHVTYTHRYTQMSDTAVIYATYCWRGLALLYCVCVFICYPGWSVCVCHFG